MVKYIFDHIQGSRLSKHLYFIQKFTKIRNIYNKHFVQNADNSRDLYMFLDNLQDKNSLARNIIALLTVNLLLYYNYATKSAFSRSHYISATFNGK